MNAGVAVRPLSPAAARPSAAGHAVFLTLSVLVIAASFALGVDGREKVAVPFTSFAVPSMCQFRNLTTLDCPGCGLSRAFIHLARGDLAGAWHYNPAAPLVFLFVLAQVPFRGVQLWRIRRGLPELHWTRLGNWALAAVTVALVVQWLGKLALAFCQR